jgi:sigma-B regulation protein RsbU (phosphoserine phosphatase)
MNHKAEIDITEIIDIMDLGHNFIGGGLWFEPYVIFPDRERYCFYAYDDGRRIVFDEKIFESEAYDYHRQKWYINIKEQLESGANIAWYGPYIDESGIFAPMTTVGAGIYAKDGELVGVSTVDLHIDFMLDLTSNLVITPGTAVSIVKEESGEVLREIGALQTDTLDFTKLFGDVRVTVSIPESELYSAVDAMMRNVFIIVLIIVLASYTIFYIVLDRLLNRPIYELALKTKEIGHGNLDTIIEIKSKDEIGELGKVINKMTSDLKLHIENIAAVTRENEHIRAELEIAGKIQQEMLPELKMDNENFDIYAEMIPCREVGGDFYDAFLIGDKNLCTVVADVSGKGVPAAIFMANAKTTIRTFAQMGLSPSEIFTKTNAHLRDGNKARMFVTAFLGILNLDTGEYKYVNAGHDVPVVTQRGQTFEFLKTEPDPALAVSQKAVYAENALRLNRGDKIFIYTDGITEAFNPGNEPFGEKRLQKALNEHKDKSLNEMAACIKNELDSFEDSAPKRDDVTMLLIEYSKV